MLVGISVANQMWSRTGVAFEAAIDYEICSAVPAGVGNNKVALSVVHSC